MTIYDMAREAGVSIATISRVLNHKSAVSRKTCEKVEAVLKKYNYTPNPAARNLVVKKTASVAILADDIRDPYTSGVCREIEKQLHKNGYTAMLCNTGGETEGIGEYIKTALAHRMDAIFVVGMTKRADEKISLAAETVPTIVINNLIDNEKVHCVICDESYGMMLAVSDLVSRGKKNILFIYDDLSDTYSIEKLTEGFEGGMEMCELSYEDKMISCSRGFRGGYACAEKLCTEKHEFDSVIFNTDTTAAGFIRFLRDNFFAVPEDVAAISFHNTDAAVCSSPSITSIDLRSDKVGTAAVNIFSDILAKGKAEHKTVIVPRLIKREST